MVAGAAAAAARGASARGGGWSRSGPGRAGEGRAVRLPSARRGRCCAPARQAPPARAPGTPKSAEEGAASPVRLSPKTHLLLFRGRGKSFWKVNGQKDRGQRGPPTAPHKPGQPPGGAEVGWYRPLTSIVTCTTGHALRTGLLGGKGNQGDSSPQPQKTSARPRIGLLSCHLNVCLCK